jgi:hypothetical protein
MDAAVALVQTCLRVNGYFREPGRPVHARFTVCSPERRELEGDDERHTETKRGR